MDGQTDVKKEIVGSIQLVILNRNITIGLSLCLYQIGLNYFKHFKLQSDLKSRGIDKRQTNREMDGWTDIKMDIVR